MHWHILYTVHVNVVYHTNFNVSAKTVVSDINSVVFPQLYQSSINAHKNEWPFSLTIKYQVYDYAFLTKYLALNHCFFGHNIFLFACHWQEDWCIHIIIAAVISNPSERGEIKNLSLVVSCLKYYSSSVIVSWCTSFLCCTVLHKCMNHQMIRVL